MMIDREQLHAFVDGELTPEEKAQVEALLDSQEALRHQVVSIRSMKLFVQEKASCMVCDTEWRACTLRLKEIDKARGVEHFVSRYAWGLCGAFFLAILVGGHVTRTVSDGSMRPGEVARIASNLPRFSSQEPDQLLESIGSAMGQTPVPSEVRIVGGAVGHVENRVVARMQLSDEKGTLSLIVIPGGVSLSGVRPVAPGSRYLTGRIDDLNCVVWEDSGLALILIGDRSPQALGGVADRVAVR